MCGGNRELELVEKTEANANRYLSEALFIAETGQKKIF